MSAHYGLPAAPLPSPHQRRFPLQPPLITTALGGPGQQAVHPLQHAPPTPTPTSSLSTPFTPYSSTSLSPVPSSASTASASTMAALRTASPMVAAYNPQTWSRSGPVAGAYVPHSSSAGPVSRSTRDITGMEASMPSPPPPYSPGQAQSMTQAARSSPSVGSSTFSPVHNISPGTGHSEYGTPASSATTASPVPANVMDFRSVASSSSGPIHGSPHMSSGSAFPPPPPREQRERSASRSKPDGKHSIFSLSSLTSRSRNPEPSGTSAMDALRQNTTNVLSRAPVTSVAGPSVTRSAVVPSVSARDQNWSPEVAIRPPAARRAASTGAISITSTPPRRVSPPTVPAWEPGMPLPPPPPGPPPNGSRSQSLNRVGTRARDISQPYNQSSDRQVAAPAPRRPPQYGTALGPIPPTPADWVDQDVRARSRSPSGMGLQVDTSYARSSQTPVVGLERNESSQDQGTPESAQVLSPSSAGGLTRQPAKRDPSARGIRERRSDSRAAKERDAQLQSASDTNNNPWARDMEPSGAKPVDLTLPLNNSTIGRRRIVRRSVQLGKSVRSPDLVESGARATPTEPDDDDQSSRQSTPKQFTPSLFKAPEHPGTTTPPFSPTFPSSGPKSRAKDSRSAIPPKALPTPPPQREGEHGPSSPGFLLPLRSQQAARPISHILHVPNEDVSMLPLLSPARPSSGKLRATFGEQTEQERFAMSCIDRHRIFIQNEAAARTDRERLELFASFIVNESRLRRDRYSSEFERMASEILDLTRDMWKPYNTPVTASPQSSSVQYTPRTDLESPASAASQGRSKETQLWSGYQPCLSPIPSMAPSGPQDEEDSRGRSASRWWEASAEGSTGRGQKIERSRRESKYMGLPREARENLQWEVADMASSMGGGTPTPSERNEYPPEKIGWHETTDQYPPPSHAPPYPFYNRSAPTTPDPYKLDVSRLVTLPPPYPRHHPAVNNNHPDLASIRSNLPSLNSMDEVMAIKDLFSSRTSAIREFEKEAANNRRKQLRLDIQQKISEGSMSFADAAKAEAEFDSAEGRGIQDRAQAEYDSFQAEVFKSLQEIYSNRMRKATSSIEELQSGLFNDAQAPNPNRAQEEGDEQPELLEKLTLLKWFFEAREQIHKDMFELECERNDRYKNVILTPYRLAKNEEKIREAEDFFNKDKQESKVNFEKQTLRRFEDFMNVIEGNVTRGVEDQLSAFWDIAPGLLAVVQKVPSNLGGLDILIPPDEYEENPSYHDFPTQYLYSLLAHAEKSAYQFIESQTNLLCLLHEVKTGVMTAGSRLLETQRHLAGEDFEHVDREMKAVRQDEEARLTLDLKEKVGLVEDQWREALGKGLRECKDRVETFLIEHGGWDDSLQE